jgi:hypothetical protein
MLSAAFAFQTRAHPGGGPDPLEILPPNSAANNLEAGALNPLSVPSYHSYPAASVKLYLNFTGETSLGWGGYVPATTPAYDTDGDTSTFSATELSNINQIWQRVSEKYSPFNIDVTTEKPADMSISHTQQIVIGGAGSWFGLVAGGVSYVGAFAGGPNTSYVFPDNLAQSNHGVPKYVAEAVAHEAGHAFGLYHQSDYLGGIKQNEYSLGTYIYDPSRKGVDQLPQPGSKSPIMGNSYFAERGLWWSGNNSNGFGVIQNDLDTIASAFNGFGYRPDDFGNDPAHASPLTITGGGYQAGGVIEKMTDKDYFSFTTSGGLVSFIVNNAPYAGMLDASVQIRDLNNQVLYESATASLSEFISADLPAGTYDLVVSGAGNYGDLGQYFISGALGALVPEPAALGLVFASFLVLSRRRHNEG